MLEQLHPSIRPTLQSITLALVYTNHPTPTPILRYLPFPDHFITQIRHPPYPIFPIALNISATTPVGPAAFSSFILLIASLTSSFLNIILSLLPSSPPPSFPTSPRPSLLQSNSSFISLS